MGKEKFWSILINFLCANDLSLFVFNEYFVIIFTPGLFKPLANWPYTVIFLSVNYVTIRPFTLLKEKSEYGNMINLPLVKQVAN